MRSEEKQIFKKVQYGDVEGLRATLASYAFPWKQIVKSKLGDNMLHVACRHGQAGVLRYILDNGKGISAQDCNAEGKCPLHEAAQVCQLECVKILIEYGSDVNALKRGDWTPLMLACTKTDNLQVVKVLVEAGADKKLKNKDGWTAFHLAAREGDENIARFLMSNDRFIWRTSSNNGRTPLHTIALHGHKTLAMLLCDAENLDVDIEDHCGITPLHDALRANYVDTAKYIISKGAHWDKRDKLGRHGLHLAAEAGAEASVCFLIEDLKIATNIRSSSGSTPLHCSAKEGKVDIVTYLVQHGADIIRDNQGRTATDLASDRGFKQVVTILTQGRGKMLEKIPVQQQLYFSSM